LLQILPDDYVNELLEKMTLDEKLAQISCIWFDKKKVIDTDGSFNPVKMKLEFPHGIGCFCTPSRHPGYGS
jgi:beta-glucosidase